MKAKLESNGELTVTVPANEIPLLQDILSYSAWQFKQGGGETPEDIEKIWSLHRIIKELTGVERR